MVAMIDSGRGLTAHYGLDNRSVLLFLLASFLLQSTLGALNVILNLYILELGFSEDFAGLLLSVKIFAAGLVCIPAGIICARWGVRRALLVASSALGLGILLLSGTHDPGWLCFSAVLVGSAQATKAVCVPVFLVENSSPRIRQNLFSFNFSLMMLANMAANACSGYLPMLWPDLLSGYSGTLKVYGIMALISLFPLSMVVARGQGAKTGKGNDLLRGYKLAWGQSSIGKLLLCHALIGFGAGLIVPLFNIFLSNRIGASSGQIGIIMAIAQIGTALGGLLVPLAVARHGKVATVVALRFASIPFLILIATLTNIYGVGVSYVLRATLMNAASPVESNFAMEIAGPQRRVAMSSLISMMNTFTRSFSVLAGGWLMARFSYSLPYFFTCVVYSMTFLLFWFWFKSYEKPAVHSHPGQ